MIDERIGKVARTLVACTIQAGEGDRALVCAGGNDAR
jgi:hypothetical protein